MRLSEITQLLLSRTALTEGHVVHNDGHVVVIQNPTRSRSTASAPFSPASPTPTLSSISRAPSTTTLWREPSSPT
jgi:hypothetical protein